MDFARESTGATRFIGTKMARHIEACFEKEEGWLDALHEVELEESHSNVTSVKEEQPNKVVIHITIVSEYHDS